MMEKLEKAVPLLAYVFGKEGVEDWKKKFAIILGCEVVFLAFALLNLFAGGKVAGWGIHPRDFPGGMLPGVLLAPWLHDGFTAMLVNAAPFAVLSGFVLMREDGVTTWVYLTFLEVVVGGGCTWAFGRAEADHNGAAPLILAYFAFLIVYGAIRREARAALIALVTVVVYGGLVWSTIPNRDVKLSWEGHLAAVFVGAMFGTWEADIVQLKAAGVGGDKQTGAGSAGAKAEAGASSEKAPLTSDDLHADDDLRDAEVGAGGVSGAKAP